MVCSSKLALGTAQFGLDYGVANQSGRMQFEDVQSVITLAGNQGIDTLDTAIAYGDSENVLGRVGVADWNLVTKLPAVPEPCRDVGVWVLGQIEGSLQRLKISVLDGVLLHRPEQLAGSVGPALLDALESLKNRGVVRKIGVSVYSHEELALLPRQWAPDLVQAPMNVLDRRLLESGWVDQLKIRGVELHVRSIFLQGLLLMSQEARPSRFGRWPAVWSAWSDWLSTTGLTPLQACLGYAMSLQQVDRVVVGVDSLAHLDQILVAVNGPMPAQWPEWLTPVPQELINPSRWSEL
jgi:aryl-alcohol dehydrogenase-like predicted oxidoreductase